MVTAGRAILFCISILAATSALSNEGRRECDLPWVVSIFEPERFPVVDLDTFAEGRLGLIRPTYDHFYLFIAHRKLLDLPPTKSDLERMRRHDPCWQTKGRTYNGYEPTMEATFQTAFGQWFDERAKIASPNPAVGIQPRRIDERISYFPFLNCNTDAFRTAARTLRERVSKHGQSTDVLDWARAQDQVFANCGSPGDLPNSVSKTAPRWLALDRDYQIAAAQFYAGRYDEAVERFDAIAATVDSPWREIAPYLAARSIIRAGSARRGTEVSLVRFAQAEARLTAMLGSPIGPEVRKDVERLLQFVQLRTRPGDVLTRIETRLASKDLPETIGQDLTDFWLAYRKGGGDRSSLPFSRWLTSFRGLGSEADPFQEWKRTAQLPWLLVTLQLAHPDSRELDEVLTAARKIPRQSPAYISVRYHIARLTRERKEAMQIIDRTLALPKTMLHPQDANALRRIGLDRAKSVGEFGRFAPRELAIPWKRARANLDSDSVSVFNNGLPLDALMEIHALSGLPSDFRRELTLVAFTRAFILKRWDVVQSLAPRIKAMVPESADLIDQLVAEQHLQTRIALGAMLLARYPGLVGNFTDTVGYADEMTTLTRFYMRRTIRREGPRENWWCGFPEAAYWTNRGIPNAQVPDEPPPAFIPTKAAAALKAERKILGAMPNATDYLGTLVMDWAARHPRDPRLPQALHMLILSSRGGCLDKRMSADMFRHLHRHFPNNQWTRKTKFHY